MLTRTAAGRLTDAYGGHVVATGGVAACVVSTAPFLFFTNLSGTAVVAAAVTNVSQGAAVLKESQEAAGTQNTGSFMMAFFVLVAISAGGAVASFIFPPKN